MSLVDMHGNPTNSGRSTLSDEQLYQILSALRMRIENLQQQQLEQGLFVEYITEQLVSRELEGQPVIQLDEDDFKNFVTKRMAQIRSDFETQQKAAHLAQAEADLAGQDINLDE